MRPYIFKLMDAARDEAARFSAWVKARGLAADDAWITVQSNGGGRHVLLGDDGTIKSGMGGKFNGQRIDLIPRKPKAPPTGSEPIRQASTRYKLTSNPQRKVGRTEDERYKIATEKAEKIIGGVSLKSSPAELVKVSGEIDAELARLSAEAASTREWQEEAKLNAESNQIDSRLRQIENSDWWKRGGTSEERAEKRALNARKEEIKKEKERLVSPLLKQIQAETDRLIRVKSVVRETINTKGVPYNPVTGAYLIDGKEYFL